MSKTVIERYFCDFCEDIILPSDHNGVKIELGYSDGGWGNRSDIIPPFSSDDVCKECYKRYKEKALEFWESLKIKKENK